MHPHHMLRSESQLIGPVLIVSHLQFLGSITDVDSGYRGCLRSLVREVLDPTAETIAHASRGGVEDS